ncbi:MAG: hypothetical protein K6A43_12715 [Treponema sp.]|nr:hypothetical protein [Treponema sp.]
MFSEDLKSFKQLLFYNKNASEIRKLYLSLLKKYHPDLANDEKKDLYKEYTTQLLLLYDDWKNKKIIVSATSVTVNNDLYKKLMKIARDEYSAYKKYELQTRWAVDDAARDYLGNAVRCYEKIIKECKDSELVNQARAQMEWVRPLYNLQNKKMASEAMKKILEKRKVKNGEGAGK